MTSQTTEIAFESTVESMLLSVGWRKGDLAEWDVDRALFPARAVAFIRDAQPELWSQVAAYYGDSMEESIIRDLVKTLDSRGTIEVLRRGFPFHGKIFRVASFRPAHGLNPDTVTLFERNELTVTRQVRCHPRKGGTVDVVLALNGLPVATCELKNPMTGQTWRDAVRQYQQGRNPDAPLFRFTKRALVHFAADPDEIHMTTRLAREQTHFLPFNRGSHPGAIRCGAGNPPRHPSGYSTGYFWQEVLERGSLLDILSSFVFIETRKEDVGGANGAGVRPEKTLIFPRYHQLDAVNKLVEISRAEGPGNNYLIQHSAGSGKTNSISWLSHRLATLHRGDEKIFDGVIVISDRNLLDSQLQEAIFQIEHAQGVVKAIDDDSRQLAEALIDKSMIVITTLQKFPFVMRGLLSIVGADFPDAPTQEEQAAADLLREAIAGRRYAVIVDEAHSSQTGESAREMKQILGSGSQEATGEAETWEDGLNAVVESRGPQPNLSFFAFTATPKAKTIELFGRPGPDGIPEPFHLYSMRQAIDEGYILDVLRNYTDYDTYYQLVKQAEDDETFPKRRTAVALAKFLTLHPYNISQKTEVMVEHFRNNVRSRIGGRAKAMVVTSSRIHAVRYMQAFQRYIRERGYDDVHPLVAFSGTVVDPETGLDYTEPGMNIDRVRKKPIGEKALRGRFASPDYQILLVAEKYQTGFNQPLLQAMYVDKRLDGVQAVQTLSRLNRVFPYKEDPFVLDFVNDPDDIQKAFAPYYDQTQISATSDPYQLQNLKHELDLMQVYHLAEVEAFAKVFYLPPAQQRPTDHARLEKCLQTTRERFHALDDEHQADFRDKLGTYVRLYAFLSQIIPYADPELERLSGFGRALLPHLQPGRDREPIHLAGAVELEYYRIQQVSTGAISLGDDGGRVRGPTAVGTGDSEDEKAPLSEIIERINERFGTDFTEGERLFLRQVQEDAIREQGVREMALANPFEKFSLGIREQLIRLMMGRMAGNDALVTRCLNDPDFQEVVFTGLLRAIFDKVTAQESLFSS